MWFLWLKLWKGKSHLLINKLLFIKRIMRTCFVCMMNLDSLHDNLFCNGSWGGSSLHLSPVVWFLDSCRYWWKWDLEPKVLVMPKAQMHSLSRSVDSLNSVTTKIDLFSKNWFGHELNWFPNIEQLVNPKRTKPFTFGSDVIWFFLFYFIKYPFILITSAMPQKLDNKIISIWCDMTFFNLPNRLLYGFTVTFWE